MLYSLKWSWRFWAASSERMLSGIAAGIVMKYPLHGYKDRRLPPSVELEGVAFTVIEKASVVVGGFKKDRGDKRRYG